MIACHEYLVAFVSVHSITNVLVRPIYSSLYGGTVDVITLVCAFKMIILLIKMTKYYTFASVHTMLKANIYCLRCYINYVLTQTLYLVFDKYNYVAQYCSCSVSSKRYLTAYKLP